MSFSNGREASWTGASSGSAAAVWGVGGGGGTEGVHARAGEVAARRTAAEAAMRREERMGCGEVADPDPELAVALTAAGSTERRPEEAAT